MSLLDNATEDERENFVAYHTNRGIYLNFAIDPDTHVFRDAHIEWLFSAFREFTETKRIYDSVLNALGDGY